MEEMGLKALLHDGLALLGPSDVQWLSDQHPDKTGLVLLTAPGLEYPGLADAVQAVAARYQDKLWAGALDAVMFPAMIANYTKRHGIDPEDFRRWLPMVGIVRGMDLFYTLSIGPVFFKGKARARQLRQMISAFAYKFAVAYTPKPKAEEAEAPKPEINREKSFKVRVIRGGKAHEITLYEGENLLDGALERGVQLEYSCKKGKCDTCTVKVLSGRENLSEPTAGEKNVLGEQLEQGKRLSCQTYVKGPVEVEQ